MGKVALANVVALTVARLRTINFAGVDVREKIPTPQAASCLFFFGHRYALLVNGYELNCVFEAIKKPAIREPVKTAQKPA